MKRSELIFSLVQIPLDFITVVLAGIAAYFLRLSPYARHLRPVFFNLPFNQYMNVLLIGGIVSIVFFFFTGLYQLKVTRSAVRELFLIVSALTSGVIAMAFYFFITANAFESRFIVFAWWIVALIFVSSERALLKKIQQWLTTHYGIGAHNVLLVGHPNPGRSNEFMREVKENPNLGFCVVSEVQEINMKKITRLLTRHPIDDVFLTDLSYPQDLVLALADFCHRMQINFSFIPSEFASFRTQLRTFPSGLAMLEVSHTPLEGWPNLIKRTLDFICAIFIGLLMLPIFLLIAISIKADSSGPVVVKLKRVREGGKIFYIYKFRSMVNNAHLLKFTTLKNKNERSDGPLFKIKNDPRITRAGRMLRRFHLDEFAQLINVLNGEMSLVGPRPHEPEEIARYRDYHLRLLSIKPGITGLSQISGASRLPFEREVELEAYYIQHWSLWLDFSILVRTFFVIFTDKEGA